MDKTIENQMETGMAQWSIVVYLETLFTEEVYLATGFMELPVGTMRDSGGRHATSTNHPSSLCSQKAFGIMVYFRRRLLN